MSRITMNLVDLVALVATLSTVTIVAWTLKGSHSITETTERAESNARFRRPGQRLGLEGQQVFSIYGENLGYVVGTSICGKFWNLSSGISVLKREQNQTWRVNGNLIGHKIFSCQDGQLWGTVTGQDGKRLILSNGRTAKLENQDRVWFVGF